MSSTGLTNYPSEYWHWSYGDQGWAYRGGHPAALYGMIEPPGWTTQPDFSSTTITAAGIAATRRDRVNELVAPRGANET